jgi:DNA polymerase sigma
MSLRVAEEVERYRAFVEHLRSIWSTKLRDAVYLEGMSSYTGKNGMLSRDITFFYGRGL